MKILDVNIRNKVILDMAELLETHRTQLIQANEEDVNAYSKEDEAFLQRLIIDDKKIDGMKSSLTMVASLPDPLGHTKSTFTHENGIEIQDITYPFGRVLIIYESRPDVTVEAAVIGFKAGNKVLLKGGKESVKSNLFLVSLWQQALMKNDCDTSYIEYLEISREETIPFLENPQPKVDLIIPRGGDGLINLVKKHAKAPVLTSGRGNNFMFVDVTAPSVTAVDIIENAKFQKTSACNALDKVLIHQDKLADAEFMGNLFNRLDEQEGTIYTTPEIKRLAEQKGIETEDFNDALWEEEFLSNKIVLYPVEDTDTAIELINNYSGGHSASILTENQENADQFLQEVDCAAVYHNASTRFTDGGEFGLGAEIGIGTEKLHHRGPLGLQHLVSNKWLIKGNGQIR